MNLCSLLARDIVRFFLFFFFFLLELIEAFSKSLLKFDCLLVDVSSFTYSIMQRVLVK